MSAQSLNPFAINRRLFFKQSGTSLGAAALASLMGQGRAAESSADRTHFAPKAKRIIYLFQSGGPAQQDLFDHKPMLRKLNGTDLPPAVRGEQRNKMQMIVEPKVVSARRKSVENRDVMLYDEGQTIG